MPYSIINFSESPSLINTYLAELRDIDIQKDPMRFRYNLRRIGTLIGYEISKELDYRETKTTTPLGVATSKVLNDKIVLCAVLRAGLSLHEGLLNSFDDAENSFFAIYRKSNGTGAFDVHLEYHTSPNIDGKVLVIADPMIATGLTMEKVIRATLEYGRPKQIHIASIIGSKVGVTHIKRLFKDIKIWIGAIDEELTAKAYIVPGLGDAGDLSYGQKT